MLIPRRIDTRLYGCRTPSCQQVHAVESRRIGRFGVPAVCRLRTRSLVRAELEVLAQIKEVDIEALFAGGEDGVAPILVGRLETDLHKTCQCSHARLNQVSEDVVERVYHGGIVASVPKFLPSF